MMRSKFVMFLILTLVVGLIVAGCSSSKADTTTTTSPTQPPLTTSNLVESPQVGSLAPDFELPVLDGQSVRLSDLRGKPVMINFWATWCPSCVYEMPFLEGAYKQKKDDGLVVLAVDVGETMAKVEQFVQEKGLTFTVLLDYRESVSRSYGIQYFPTTFLVDKDGIIRLVKVGAFVDEAAVISALKRIM